MGILVALKKSCGLFLCSGQMLKMGILVAIQRSCGLFSDAAQEVGERAVCFLQVWQFKFHL